MVMPDPRRLVITNLIYLSTTFVTLGLQVLSL